MRQVLLSHFRHNKCLGFPLPRDPGRVEHFHPHLNGERNIIADIRYDAVSIIITDLPC